MKKLVISIFFSLLYISSASAEFGVNVGASGSAGVFTASAKEINPTSSATTGTGSEHGSAAWGSLFLEASLNDKFMVGIDYVPTALETDTTETAKTPLDTNPGAANTPGTTSKTNKIQVDFEHLTTLYAAVMITDNFYAKAGLTTVDVITNESLGTGSQYGNTELDGSLFGVGYHNALDNGTFFRFEGNYMNFDGAALTSSTNADRRISLRNLDGLSGKISVGKSF